MPKFTINVLFICSTLVAIGCGSHHEAKQSVSVEPATSQPAEKVTPPTVEVPAVGVRVIEIPNRENGYHNFESMVIMSAAALTTFLKVIELETNWSQKAQVEFIDVLRDSHVDYETESLVLIRITSGSGSTKISLADPVIEGTDIVFRSIWKEPTWLTADMTYYCYARVVPNDVAENVRITTKYRKDLVIPLPK